MILLEIETTTSDIGIRRIYEHNEVAKKIGFDYVLLSTSKYLKEILTKMDIKSYTLSDFAKGLSRKEQVSIFIEQDLIVGEMFYEFREFSDKSRYFNKAKNLSYMLEKAFEKLDPDLIIQCQGVEIIRLLSHKISKKLNIPSFFYGFSPFGMAFYDTPFADNWVKNKLEDCEKSINFAKSYLKAFNDGSVNFLTSQIKASQDNFFNIPNRRDRYLKRLIVSFKNKSLFNDLYSIIRPRVISKCRKFRGVFRRFLLKGNTKLPKKFFFFPLHLPIESQVTIRGNRFLFQSMIISMLSYMLPEDTYIITREHPKYVGFLKRWELDLIKRHKNIILINSKIPAREIIKRSLGVITYNSTTGFEGILLGKPVITIGKSFFRGNGVTYDCENLNDAYDFINNIATNPEAYKIDFAKILDFVARVYESSYNNLGEFLDEKKSIL